MPPSRSPREFSRRELSELALAGAVLAASHARPALAKERLMKVTCFIRYQIDPFQRDAFRRYAENWARIIPRCGGHLVGYFLPDEGTNDVAWGLIALEDLAAYEAYRATLRADPEAQANFQFAESKRIILREERTFLENVQGTIGFTADASAAWRDFPPHAG